MALASVDETVPKSTFNTGMSNVKLIMPNSILKKEKTQKGNTKLPIGRAY
jgi:hypothetical protein